MPLLGGFFSKKNKLSSRSKQDDQTTTTTTTATTELDSNVSSPTSSSYHTQYTSRQQSSNTIARTLLHPETARAYHSNNIHSPLSISQSSPLPSPPPPPHSSGHKLRLFGRKKSNISGSDLTSASTSNLNQNNLFSTSPRSSFTHRETTSIDGQPPPLPESQDSRRLRPPPSRSAIFAAYGDPNSALSTRSLPNESQLPSSSSDPLPPSPSSSTARPPRPQNPHKRPSLFVWSKTSTSSPITTPKAPGSFQYESNLSPNSAFDSGSESVVESTQGSFALKSFRNVREPSPANNSNVSLSAPIPRPRGESINSESSQRISVAAFREAQARRSMAGSPSPSFRSPSPSPAIPQLPMLASDPPRGRASPNPSRSSPQMRNNQNRRQSLMPVSTSESDDTGDSSDPSSEDDETMRPRISMNHTRLPQRSRSGKTKAKSEMGHGSKLNTQNSRNDYPVPSRPARSHTGHSITTSSSVQPRSTPRTDVSPNPQEVASRPHSTLSNNGNGSRQRASASASALTPSAAAKRASVLAASNAAIFKTDDKQFLASTQHPKAPAAISGRTNSSVPTKPTPDSGSDSDDDAPLATLVAPRRPGSAMSSYSATYSRSTGNVSRTGHLPKPLIDINELTNPKRPVVTSEKSNDGFTQGHTLLSSQTKESFTGSQLVHSPTAIMSSLPPLQSETITHPLTRTVPPHKFISPPSSPPKELKQYFSDQSLAESSATSNISPPARDSSPEASRRVPLTDRLSRAVKLNTSPSTAHNLNASSTNSSPEEVARLPQPTKSVTTPLPPPTIQSRNPGHRRLSSRMKAFSTPAAEKSDPSPPDEDLRQLLGMAGINFISRTGDSSSESSDTESEPENEKAPEVVQDTSESIAPIPIKQRSPPPAFSVTSRPSFPKRDQGAPSVASFQTTTSDSKSTSASPPTNFTTPRQRSSTLIPSGSSSNSITPKPTTPLPSQQNKAPHPGRSNPTYNSAGTSGTQPSSATDRNSSLRPPGTRQRSSTMITGVPLSSQMPKAPSHLTQTAPERPFAPRRDSPASSIGDSSSGRAPLTPKDGSDIAPPSDTQSTIKKRNEWNSGVSGLGVKQHIKRRSVSFEEDERDPTVPVSGHLRGGSKARNDPGSGDTSNEEDREVRRRERRRSEARAAIELGNVINGRGPVVSDDDDDDMPLNSQMTMNPMMAQGGQIPGSMAFGAPNQMMWPGNMNMGTPGMLSPAQFMLPPPVSQDQNFLVAHQQAMFFAKQAYQMAVAQQAMAAAADEWERGSAIGGFGGGGSVYGGSTGSPSLMVPPYMNMGMGMNMNMMQPNQWSSGSSVYMPSSSRSMYGGMMGGITSSRSEYGGGAPMGNKWGSSRSTYGESFGPSSSAPPRKSGDTSRKPLLSGVAASQRDSGYFPPMPPTMPATQNRNGRGSPDLRGPGNNMRARTASQPASPTRSQGHPPRKAAPPSSWKASGV